MDRIVSEIGTFLAAIIGLAALSVILSRNAATSQVITSAGNALGGVIKAATSPVSGGGSSGLPSLPSLPSLGG